MGVEHREGICRFDFGDPLDCVLLRLVLPADDVGIFTIDAQSAFFFRSRVDRHLACADRRTTLGNEIHDLIVRTGLLRHAQ